MFTFRDNTHPAANDQEPQIGDQGFVLHFDLEKEEKLAIHLGIEGLANITASILRMMESEPELAQKVKEAMTTVEMGDGKMPGG